MPERMGRAFWPGVTGFVSCQYTVSHGAGPGIASLEIPEGDLSRVAGYGDLVITDGVGTVTLRNARVVDVQFSNTGGPRTVVLAIADRRWMWRFGNVRGRWNQPDPFPDPDLFPPGEYVLAGGPYAKGTYRPAHKLMADCLRAMGERPSGPGAWQIEKPPEEPVPVVWDDEVPSQALDAVAAELGYRLVYQPNADRALVAPQGEGAELPTNLPTVSASASFDLPGRPAAIRLRGGPIVWQDWLALEPVGLEKDGTVRHINELSYAPAAPRPGVWVYRPSKLEDGATYGAEVTVFVGGVGIAGNVTSAPYAAPQSERPVLTHLANLINAHPFLSLHVRAEVVEAPYTHILSPGVEFTYVLRVTGKTPATQFKVDTPIANAFNIDRFRERDAEPDRKSWENCTPPYFGRHPDEGTADMTAAECEDFARRYIWRTFRVKMVDVQAGGSGPNVGGYGRVFDRTEIVLGDRVFFGDRGITGEWAGEPPFCVGTIFVGTGGGVWGNNVDKNGNTTSVGFRLPFQPQIDSERGLVTFDQCLFYRESGSQLPEIPDLWVYTSFTLRSVVGRIPVCLEVGDPEDLGAAARCPAEWVRRPDLVRLVRTLRKDADFSITAIGTNDDEVLPRAEYLLTRARDKYAPAAAGDRTYAGIWPIDPDGALQQVTWSVGGGARDHPRQPELRARALPAPVRRAAPGRRGPELRRPGQAGGRRRRGPGRHPAVRVPQQEPVPGGLLTAAGA